MGKHETGFERVDRDHYPTPSWPVADLCEHVDITRQHVWEPACGSGQMVTALKDNGAASVVFSDIVDRGFPGTELFDFTSDQRPPVGAFTSLITNPPFGARAQPLATRFAELGLQRLPPGGLLALLLPTDFDSAKSRRHLFADCAQFDCKIVLTKRIVWFARPDGTRESPKENHAWYVWQRPGQTPSLLKPVRFAGELRYTPRGGSNA